MPRPIRQHLCIIFACLLPLSQNAFACWRYTPPEQDLSYAHVVVTGTITHVSWNKSRTVVVNGTREKRKYRIATLKIAEVLKNDLSGVSVEPGGTLQLWTGPKPSLWPWKRGLSICREPCEKGMAGGWALWYYREGFVLHAGGGRMQATEVGRARRILGELERAYQEANEERIPALEERREQILSLPPFPPSRIEAAIREGRGVPDGIDLSRVYVPRLPHPMQGTVFLDSKGRLLGGIPYTATDRAFWADWLHVAVKHHENGATEYGFVDRHGNPLPELPYEPQGPFRDGLALVSAKGKYGLVDTAGKEIVPCIYDWPTEFTACLTRVTKGEEAFLLNQQGEVILQTKANLLPANALGDGLALVLGRGYVDGTGRLVIDTTGKSYAANEPFSGGFAKVRIFRHPTERASFINRQGELIFPPIAAQFGHFSEGLVPFCEREKTDRWGYMDTLGNVVIPPLFVQAGEFRDGRAFVDYLDWIERPAVPTNDENVRLSDEAPRHVLVVRKGFINRDGKLVSPMGFDYAEDFQSGLARVQCHVRTAPRDEFCGLMDRDGRIVFVLSNPLSGQQGTEPETE